MWEMEGGGGEWWEIVWDGGEKYRREEGEVEEGDYFMC